ncbi:ABC transporter permease subunit [Streptomyces inhibens]|uniref:ABC transporter permease subunit n=1 Tax=Streptomyces inhibens TaxID=2293571 RepID=UPI001EE75E78|nr:ABC transporter permease subunit [Streptomyces inhibens]UKY50746.1 ABC transporter permease [Streptomyces inhibens]
MSRNSTAGPADTRRTTSATAAASVPAETAAPRRGLPRGLAWLVWRRHRALLRTGLLVTVAGCALFAYQRIGVMDFLHTKGSSPGADGRLLTEFQSNFGPMFNSDTQYLRFLPFVIGVFLGAPLIAGEQEHGTIRLVTTQSVSRGRWIAATLGLPLAVAVLCTTLLSAAFTWLWSPAHELVMSGDWLQSGAFESTGPIPVATTVFLTACGIALGMLIKRVVPAMAATAVFAAVTSVIWSEKVRDHLGTLRSVTYPYDAGGPDLPRGSVRIDDWVSTADGKLYGFGTCVNGDTTACRAKLGIVNRVTQYFDYAQMPGMQWLGAGILLALAAMVLALVVWRAHRRPL